MASITRLLRSGTRFSLTRGYATKTTATTTAKPVDVSAYLQQNFQEPNYAAWGAPSAGSSSSAHFDPFVNMRNIFGDLDQQVDVTEYSRAKGMEPDYSATVARSRSSPPTTGQRGAGKNSGGPARQVLL